MSGGGLNTADQVEDQIELAAAEPATADEEKGDEQIQITQIGSGSGSSSNSSDAEEVGLASQAAAVLSSLSRNKIRKEMEENPPWKFKFRYKILVDWGVPILLIILLISASADRKERESTGTVCQVSTFVTASYLNTTSNLNIDMTSSDVYTDCYTLDNDGLSKYEPVNRGWKIILSLYPFICVFQGVLAYDLSSRYVAPFTLLVTTIIGFAFFEDRGWWVRDDGTPSNAVEVAGLVFLTIVDRVMWTVFEYAFNVFTAFFFLRVLELWGVVDQMRIEFERMCPSDGRKVLLILFCFAVMIAVVAPGGSNFLIAGAIMVDMNHRLNEDIAIRDETDKRIGAICLFGNGLTSAFNLVGVCILAISADILYLADEVGDDKCPSHKFKSVEAQESCAAKQIGGYFSLMFFIFSVISPVIMAGLYNLKPSWKDKFNDLKPDLIPMFLCGFVYAVMQLITAWFIGPELVCLLAAGLSLLTYYVYQQCKVYGREMGGRPNFKKRLFAIPFVLLVLLLCCIRLIPGVEDALQGGDNATAQEIFDPYVLDVHYLSFSFERHFGWLSHSGTSVLIVSILTPFLVPYFDVQDDAPAETVLHGDMKDKKTDPEKIKRALTKQVTTMKIMEELTTDISEKRKFVLLEAFKRSVGEALPVMVSIGSYASIAKVMAKFEMTQTVALAVVDMLKGAPGLYAAFIPVIGMIGSGLTGSTTTSNFLFGQLQVQTAVDLNLVSDGKNSIWEIAAGQIFGATGGEIISPMNAVFSTLLLAGRFPESDLIKLVLKTFGWWMVGCILISVIFIVPRDFID